MTTTPLPASIDEYGLHCHQTMPMHPRSLSLNIAPPSLLQVDIIRYTDDEYRQHLAGEVSPVLTAGQGEAARSVGGQRWSKEETDMLFDLCRRFDLRWSVIADRYRCTARPHSHTPPCSHALILCVSSHKV